MRFYIREAQDGTFSLMDDGLIHSSGYRTREAAIAKLKELLDEAEREYDKCLNELEEAELEWGEIRESYDALLKGEG